MFHQTVSRHEALTGFASKPFTKEDRLNYFGSSYSVVKGYTDQLMHHYKESSSLECDSQSPRMTANAISSRNSHPIKLLNIPNSVAALPELVPVLLKLMKKKH